MVDISLQVVEFFTMDGKRWLHVLLFTFIVAGLFANLFIKDSNEAQHTHNHMGELMNTSDERNQQVSISTPFLWLKNWVLNLAWGMWQFNDVPVSEQPHRIVLSPNLSTCHTSFAADDYLIYCCPPKPESDESFIDFKLPDPSSPKRTRRPIHLANDDYIAKYTRALTIMKSLPYDDPRSYRRQADMHCIYCTGAYNQNNENVGFNIHRSWLFFPWHRMLIYYHERTLAKLIDDDTFSLSFWQWDHPDGMVVPDLYQNEPFVDTERSAFHAEGHKIADLNYDEINRNLTAEVQVAKNLNFMYNQMVSGAKKVELFMGCTYKRGEDGGCDGPGTIELAPHNTLHTWLGKETNRYLENMGVFYSAGRDPIFWAHHPNIDRLWEAWKELRGYEPEIVDPDWLDTYFFFHDENAQQVRVQIRDILNITMLGYSYEKVDLPWLDARPKPSIDPAIARHNLSTRKYGNLAAESSDFRPQGRRLDSTFTVEVFRPHGRRANKGEEVVLVVYGIDIKGDMAVKFDVYVNAVDATTIGAESREFAGTFVNVPRGVTLVPNEGDKKINRKATLKLGISELLEDLQADEDEFIWVTLVPRGGTGVTTTVDGIRIEYMV